MGPAGATPDVTLVTAAGTVQTTAGPVSITADCPVGTFAVGGGGEIITGTPPDGNVETRAFISTNRPETDLSGWTVEGARRGGGGQGWGVSAYVICATNVTFTP